VIPPSTSVAWQTQPSPSTAIEQRIARGAMEQLSGVVLTVRVSSDFARTVKVPVPDPSDLGLGDIEAPAVRRRTDAVLGCRAVRSVRQCLNRRAPRRRRRSIAGASGHRHRGTASFMRRLWYPKEPRRDCLRVPSGRECVLDDPSGSMRAMVSLSPACPPGGTPYLRDNPNWIRRLFDRFVPYARISARALTKGTPVGERVRTHRCRSRCPTRRSVSQRRASKCLQLALRLWRHPGRPPPEALHDREGIRRCRGQHKTWGDTEPVALPLTSEGMGDRRSGEQIQVSHANRNRPPAVG
jgi:hypothetical protein